MQQPFQAHDEARLTAVESHFLTLSPEEAFDYLSTQIGTSGLTTIEGTPIRPPIVAAPFSGEPFVAVTQTPSRRNETIGVIALMQSADLPVIAIQRVHGVHLTTYQTDPVEGFPLASRQIDHIEPITLNDRSRQPNGYRFRYEAEGLTYDTLIFPAQTKTLYLRTPFSTSQQTSFWDLDGDGTREIVQIAVVFEARGRREIVVDAYRWANGEYHRAKTLSLLRRINGELDALRAHLEKTTGGQGLGEVLTPIEGAPSIEGISPINSVVVPSIEELSLDVSRNRWQFAHEVAINGNLYQLTIIAEANPFTTRPAYIVGRKGM